MNSLKAGTQLQNGKYRIERVLGQGGFGITYLATQELLDRKVCIKEFFFKDYCNRDGETSQVTIGTQSNHETVERFMNKFLKEARTISQLDHSNIVKIHDIFKENNTAYYVMDYIEGCSLNDIINSIGPLPSDEAVGYIKPIAEALEYLHESNINHLDIKPANIMVRSSDSKAVLIDFGVSKQYDEQGGQTSTTPVGISHGYAPMEQYKQGGVSTFSPQTDIYALGATLYKLVTGKTPPQAMDVLDDGLPPLPSSVTPAVANAIKKAMQPLKKDRPQSVKEFLEILNNTAASKQTSSYSSSRPASNDESTVIVDAAPKPTYSSEPAPKVSIAQEKEKPSYTKHIIGIVAVVLAIIIGVVWTNNNSTPEPVVEEEPVVDSTAVVEPGTTQREEQERLAEDIAEAQCKLEEEEIFTVVEKQPSFPGGEEKLFEYLYSNVKYPQVAKENGITGCVFLTFVVEKDGSIANPKVMRDIGGGCGQEALRVVKSMPKWIPGEQRGRPVRVRFNLPIVFGLE